MENLLVTTGFLIDLFNTNINVLEIASYNNGILNNLLNEEISYTFIEDMDPILHRTRYLNGMMNLAKTPFVAIWDVDVIANKEQLINAVDLLRKNKADFVYPYNAKLLDASFIIRKLFLENGRQIEFLNRNENKMKEMYPPVAVGGAFFCRLDAYINIGLENEEFYGWGVEDGERYSRWQHSLYKTDRVKGFKSSTWS